MNCGFCDLATVSYDADFALCGSRGLYLEDVYGKGFFGFCFSKFRELYTIGPNIPASEFQSFLTLIYSVTLLSNPVKVPILQIYFNFGAYCI